MFYRECPECKHNIPHISERSVSDAIRWNRLCRSCSKRKTYTVDQLTRKCPKCNIEMVYKNKPTFRTAEDRNCTCKKCQYDKMRENPTERLKGAFFKKGQRPANADFRKDKNIYEIYGEEKGAELVLKFKERKWTKETNIKRSESCRRANCGLSNLGKRCTEENKTKFRLNMVERLRKTNQKFHPPYNKKGCEIFDKIMKEGNVVIQHALNGGEFHIQSLGYWVDGYDHINNIVYEYDEKWHFDVYGNLKEKDIIRQKQIEDLMGCLFVRIKGF